MSGIATAIVGGAVIGAEATGRASDAQADAAKGASATEWAMYQQNREDMLPFREAGVGAVEQMGDENLGIDPAQLASQPGYQFRMNQGMDAITGNQAAKGMLHSGSTLKGLTEYGQNFASNEYDKAYNRKFNRLSQLAGIGTGTQAQLTQAGSQTAGNIGANMMGAGNARAAANMANARNFTNMLGQGMQYYAMQ